MSADATKAVGIDVGQTPPVCPFCGDVGVSVYRMAAYGIYRCGGCGSGLTCPLPDSATLKAFYHGFLPDLQVARVKALLPVAESFLKQFGWPRGRPGRFLDVGGGGGLFAWAFEQLGYGESTYVDLDPVSCRFARDELGLTRVINADVMTDDAAAVGAYDLVYARHVVEHLPEPDRFLRKMMELAGRSGTFVMQCPNSESLEYLGYPLLLWPRIRSISRATGVSWVTVIRLFLGGRMLHGIDPPRHLWALSPEGVRRWAARQGVACQLSTAHLGDRPFSPQFAGDRSWRGRLYYGAGLHLFSRFRGGTHLVAALTQGAAAEVQV